MTNDKRPALGRGLDALLPSSRPQAAATARAPEPGEAVQEIPLEQIERNPYQTRRHLDQRSLDELAASVRANGVMQPVLLRKTAAGRFQLIAGERRWLASQRAGKTTVPAIVRQVSDQQAMEMTIVENLQREDLNPMEQAQAYSRLAQEFGLTQEQMAQRTGKDRTTVANFLRLLKLPAQVQSEIEAGELNFGHAKALLMLTDPDLVLKSARRIQEKHMSVRQSEEFVRSLIAPLERAPRPHRPVDPNVRAAERQLEQALGVRVTIKDRHGRGAITLEYGSLEDFDRILEMLSRK